MKAANSAALRGAASLTAICLLTSCGGPKGVTPPPKLEAVAFVAQVNTELVGLAREANAAGWTQQTYITPDTQYLNARVTDQVTSNTSAVRRPPLRSTTRPRTSSMRRRSDRSCSSNSE